MTGQRKDGITSLSRLRARCSVADRSDPDCCWHWNGGVHGGRAAVWLSGKVVGAQYAAVILSGRTVPVGGRCWATCGNALCANPKHAATGTYAEWGEWIRQSRAWVGNVKRIAAVRRSGRKQTQITPELIAEVVSSPETGVAIAARLGESPKTISKIRRGRMKAFEPVGWMFAGATITERTTA